MKMVILFVVGFFVGIFGATIYLQEQIDSANKSFEQINQMVVEHTNERIVENNISNIYLLDEMQASLETIFEKNGDSESMLIYVSERLNAELEIADKLKVEYRFREDDLKKFEEIETENKAILEWFK